jgi:allantoinase
MTRLLVRGARVLLPDGIRPAAIHIEDGVIVEVTDGVRSPAGVRVLDAGERIVLPGLVDTHVHINDPGRADWEGFEHATRAAAAGGVTTVVDMPLNSIPSTTTVNAFEAKLRAARGRCHVDVGFWGGVVPGNALDLAPLGAHGVLGFKCFLSPSGVDEFQHVNEDDLRKALPHLAVLQLPLLVHAELPEKLRDPDPRSDPRDHATWLATRPPDSELAAIQLLARLARETGATVHVVHLASADAIPELVAARTTGAQLTVETCPHYLTFAAEDVPIGATAFKCAPPIRPREYRERLWAALEAGQIDMVASDHSPAPAALKRMDAGDFLQAWGGIASLQIALAAMWTGMAHRGLPIERLARWMTEGPAKLAGLQQIKGSIAAGRDADLVIWDPDAETIVDPFTLRHRHPITPYAGMRVRGRVERTLLRGEIVFEDGGTFTPPRGRQLLGRGANARIAG